MSITVVTGPPGAGKTTVSALLARTLDLSIHIRGDDLFHWIVSGYVHPWQAGAADQNTVVTAATGSVAGLYAAAGYDVVVDGIIGPWFLERFADATGVSLTEIDYVVLRPDRVTARQRAVGRGPDQLIDESPIALMYRVFEDLGRFETNVVDSTGLDAQLTTDILAKGLRERRFRITPEHLPDMMRLAKLHGTMS